MGITDLPSEHSPVLVISANVTIWRITMRREDDKELGTMDERMYETDSITRLRPTGGAGTKN